MFPMKNLKLVAAALITTLPAAVAGAGDSHALLDQLRGLEAKGASLLVEHYRFEEALLAPDNDRMTVFLSLPYGARVILKNATLYLDGKVVLRHVFSLRDLEMLRDRATKVFYVSRIPPGEHSLKLDVQVFQGEVRPMAVYGFAKGRNAKFVHFQIDGADSRQVVTSDW